MIRLKTMTQTVRLFGQSSHPRRIRGVFRISSTEIEFEEIELEVFESHLNRVGDPLRLVCFPDPTPNCRLATKIGKNGLCNLQLWNESEHITFSVERSSIQVVGESDQVPSEIPYCGVANIVQSSEILRLYEFNSRNKQYFYITASPEILLRIEKLLEEEGECLLNTEVNFE